MSVKPIHIAAGVAGVVGIGALYYFLKPKTAAAAQLTSGKSSVVAPVGTTEVAPVQVAKASSFDASKALSFVLDTTGRSLTVRPGQNIRFSKTVGGLSWATPPDNSPSIVSSNPLVLAPVPGTITDFVAVGEGAAQITAYYFADDGSGLASLKATIFVSATA